MKATKWIIIRVGATGVKVRGGEEYKTYDIACMMQKILEKQNPYTNFLVYTTDEWARECA